MHDDELKDFAHAALEEALSFGVSVDVFLRLARTVAQKQREAIATHFSTEFGSATLAGDEIARILRAPAGR